MKTRRYGRTVIETLTVLVIIGVLLSLVIPAVQYAREFARRTTCLNNLRQIAIAIQNHESAHSKLPSFYNGSFLPQPRGPLDEFCFHSWRSVLLPQLDESVLHQRINFSIPSTDASNQKNLISSLPVFLCPSANSPHRVVPEIFNYYSSTYGGWVQTRPAQNIGPAARSDYEVVAGVVFPVTPPRPGSNDLRGIKWGVWGEPTYNLSTGRSVNYRTARYRDVTDGLSNTIVVAERAGRPDIYDRGKSVDPYPYSPRNGMDVHQAAWGISTHIGWLVFQHNQSINQTNRSGIYSFHSNGANVAFADGCVRFISETIDQSTLNAIASRSDGDHVDLD